MEFLKAILGDAYVEDMSAEDAILALEKSEVLKQGEELSKLKAALSKSNSENADWKKKYRELENTGNAAADNTQKTLADLQEKYNGLMRDKSIAENNAQFLGLGYSAELAMSTAEAIVNGDMAKVFENQKSHQEAYSKKIQADLLKQTPYPPSGGASTETEFKTMTVTEKMKLKISDPQLYEKLSQTNGG